MQIAIDIGNSSLKAGIFPVNRDEAHPETASASTPLTSSNEPTSIMRTELDNPVPFYSFLFTVPISRCIISSTSIIPEWLTKKLTEMKVNTHVMDADTPLPIKNLYATPKTLGTDRISSVIGAFYATKCQSAVLCIDSGTALTYDIINKRGEYLGGNISPGQDMRFRSLHDFTSRLPLVEAEGTSSDIGTSTETAIRNGVMNGIQFEINGCIGHFRRKYRGLKVFFTGGNAENFADRTKNYIFADKYLVLKGLNIILNHIYQK